jgi:hypothetical protein
MKLTVFQSEKGDCLLLTSKGSKRILIDGGMADSYTEHVAPTLSSLQKQGRKLDVVYISHIDEDHISGVLQMLDDVVSWRVHEYQIAHGNPGHRAPASDHPRPPEIGGIWHNAFHEQVGKNAGAIQDMLAAVATILSGASSEALRRASEEHRELGTSMKQAMQVSRRVSRELKIPLNAEFGNCLMTIRPNMPALALGGMKLLLIGPFAEDLEKLRDEWNAWLRTTAGKAAVRSVENESDENVSGLGANAMPLLAPFIAASRILGNRSKVTTPNLASLMFFVEENGRTLLLTGDGHWQDILKGLAHHGKLSAAGDIHVNALKVQHHGSEHNLNAEFCRAVIADHYIFCGNGAHENPDLDVVETLVNSRIGAPTQRSKHVNTNRPFKLWFNSNSSASSVADNRAHMAKVETLVQTLKARSAGQMSATFLTGSKFEFTI